MKRFRNILSLTLLTAASLFSAMPAGAALTAENFAENSLLSSGEWVKVSVDHTGVCAISYDQLREMGFSRPESVWVYGRGAEAIDDNFCDKTGKAIYSDDLKAVPVLHRDNKIYFFAQGTETLDFSAQSQIWRKALNVYDTHASYFLAQGRTDGLEMPTEPATSRSYEPYTEAYYACLIESDKFNYNDTGEEYFGWDLLKEDVKIAYDIPGFPEEGGSVTFAIDGAYNNTADTNLNVYINPEGGEQTLLTSIPAKHLDRENAFYYHLPSSRLGHFYTCAAPTGKGYLTFSPDDASKTTYLALDRVVVTARRQLSFGEGETMMTVYATDFTSLKGDPTFTNAPENLMVWTVAAPSEVSILPVKYNGTTATALGMPNCKNRIIAFTPDASGIQTITGYEKVTNTNLHSIGTKGEDIPDMVIITTPDYRDQAEEIARLHKTYQGDEVKVVMSGDIVNEFSQGVRDPMAYRAFARMLYARDNADNRRFRNILLLGKLCFDNRGVVIPTETELLISKETANSENLTFSFSVPTYYGMMSDYNGNLTSGDYLWRRTEEVGVGVLPALTPTEAKIAVSKIASWFTDETQVLWLNEGCFTADGTNENEHLNRVEETVKSWVAYDGGSFIQHKLYNNCLEAGQIRPAFLAALSNGQFWGTYFGHASQLGLNTRLWNKGDAFNLTNTRIGFLRFAGCNVSPWHQSVHGSGDEMIFAPDHGIFGCVSTTRSSLSVSNRFYMCALDKAALFDEVGGGKLSAPRTFGEVNRIGNNIAIVDRQNSNRLAYHLLCDPGLIAPFPSAAVTLALDGNEATAATELAPGSSLKAAGTITDREGNILKEFNGTVVLKVSGPARTINTFERDGSESVPIVHDDDILLTAPITVTEGKFEARINIPAILGDEGAKGKLRLFAMDRSSRRTADGVYPFTILAATGSGSEADESPVIESHFLNSEQFSSGDAVAPSFTMYATVTDDKGLAPSNVTGARPLFVTFDGRSICNNVAEYLTIGEGGRTMSLALPVKDMRPGLHTATFTVSDISGNVATSTIHFVVTSATAESTTLSTDSYLARECAEISIETPSDAGYTLAKRTLVVTDALGNDVLTKEIDSDTYTWNLLDKEGKRVTEGVYRLVCRYVTSAGVAGVTAPARVIVIRETNRNS